jgi:hypothetical protein
MFLMECLLQKDLLSHFARLKYAFLVAIAISVGRLICDQTVFGWIAKICVPKPASTPFEYKVTDQQRAKLEAFAKTIVEAKREKRRARLKKNSKSPAASRSPQFTFSFALSTGLGFTI